MSTTQVRLEAVAKDYGSTAVLRDIHLEVNEGEFVVAVGPSGCGKSTLLRIIAGLTPATCGSVSVAGHPIDGTHFARANVAFVFQSYALYPQMTVRENVAFPLLMARFRWYDHLPVFHRVARRRAMKATHVNETVHDIAETMGLTPHLGKKPRELSGGERQRVALARALVRRPAVYLLDEPLSNLDAKLRVAMRSEIVDLHRRVHGTFIYVTHDQVEAMSMGTRILVLDGGRIQQDGSPETVYRFPSNTFVASFIGSPPMNLIIGDVENGTFRDRETGAFRLEVTSGPAAGRVILGVRPEDVRVEPFSGVDSATTARVTVVENLGGEKLVGLRLVREGTDAPRSERHGLIFARTAPDVAPSPGAVCTLEFRRDKLSWFDAESGQRRDDIEARTEGALR